MRAKAFAVNIFTIHALGDVPAPPLMGWITDHSGGNWNASFILVSVMMLLAGAIWLMSTRSLAKDTEAVRLHEANDC